MRMSMLVAGCLRSLGLLGPLAFAAPSTGALPHLALQTDVMSSVEDLPLELKSSHADADSAVHRVRWCPNKGAAGACHSLQCIPPCPHIVSSGQDSWKPGLTYTPLSHIVHLAGCRKSIGFRGKLDRGELSRSGHSNPRRQHLPVRHCRCKPGAVF